jgi:hypothetical protein
MNPVRVARSKDSLHSSEDELGGLGEQSVIELLRGQAMGVMLTALLVDAVAVFGLCALLFWLSRKRPNWIGRRTAVMLAIVVAFCGVLSFVPMARWAWASTVTQGKSVARSDFDGIGPSLPAAVERITYYSDYGGCEAVFAVKECVIVAWASQEKWRVSEVGAGRSVSLARLGISRTVTDGLFIEEQFSPRGTGVIVVFDRSTGDCFYRFNSH